MAIGTMYPGGIPGPGLIFEAFDLVGVRRCRGVRCSTCATTCTPSPFVVSLSKWVSRSVRSCARRATPQRGSVRFRFPTRSLRYTSPRCALRSLSCCLFFFARFFAAPVLRFFFFVVAAAGIEMALAGVAHRAALSTAMPAQTNEGRSSNPYSLLCRALVSLAGACTLEMLGRCSTEDPPCGVHCTSWLRGWPR